MEPAELLPTSSTNTEGATHPPQDLRMRALTPDERTELGLYHMVTAEERLAAPPFKEISPKMVKTHIRPLAVFAYNQECKRKAKELDNYHGTCRTIFTQLLTLLPRSLYLTKVLNNH